MRRTEAHLGPGFLRQVGAALAAKDIERAWALVDRAGVSDPVFVARALVVREKLSFIGRLLKELPAEQRSDLHEMIACVIEGRPPRSAPAKSVPDPANSAWHSEDARAFLAAAAAMRASVSGILIAAIEAAARQSYPALFQRELTLISLQFDHTTGPRATSALHLRRDGRTTVSRPEWVRGNTDFEDSPVLFAADLHSASSVVVKARLSTSLAQFAKSVEIRALEGGTL
jgi:hypothetical protein